MVTVHPEHSAHNSAHCEHGNSQIRYIFALYSIILAVSVLAFNLIISAILCVSVPVFVFFCSNAHIAQFLPPPCVHLLDGGLQWQSGVTAVQSVRTGVTGYCVPRHSSYLTPAVRNRPMTEMTLTGDPPIPPLPHPFVPLKSCPIKTSVVA